MMFGLMVKPAFLTGRRRLPILLALLMLFVNASASIDVSARLDSTSVLMGRTATLHLTVEEPKGSKGRFEIFSTPSPDGIYRVCNDSVELRTPVKADTADVSNGRIKIDFSVPVQVFDSGAYQLPRFLYLSAGDTASTKSVRLVCNPVKNVTAETPIDDYMSVENPEDSSIFDKLPDWLYNYWWLILLALAVGVAAWLLYRRYRKEGVILPKKPEPTPYEQAIRNLHALKERKLWERGMEKEYFTDLTEILRIYLDRRFGINALEMTSRQIMQTLTDNERVKDKRAYIRQILDIADFVKFAKIRPLPADNIEAYENAVKFVEETKPDENELKEKADSKNEGSGAEVDVTAVNGKTAKKNIADSKKLKNNKKGGVAKK